MIRLYPQINFGYSSTTTYSCQAHSNPIMKQKSSKLKLPKSLVDQIEHQSFSSGGSSFRIHPSARKDHQKSARKRNKVLKSNPPPPKRTKLSHDSPAVIRNRSSFDSSSFINVPIETSTGFANLSELGSTTRVCKEIQRSNPKKLTEDEREIAELERKLGLHKSHKSLQSLKDDGLDQFLEGLEDCQEPQIEEEDHSKAVEDAWLSQKRYAARISQQKRCLVSVGHKINTDSLPISESRDSKLDKLNSLIPDSSLNGHTSVKELAYSKVISLDLESFEGFDSDDVLSESDTLRAQENTILSHGNPSRIERYRPPSLNNVTPSDSEENIRLRRRIQGLINKLTESNLISILSDIEKLYREHPRQQVTMTLIDILLVSICKPTSLPDTLIILPAGFIAATYKVIGADFGAEIVQRITEMWDEYYPRARTSSLDNPAMDVSKEPSNLIMLLAEMYNFKVIGSNLLFDYVRSILGELSELNAELVLKVIRASGPQLRQDDPSSIKNIVTTLRDARANLEEEHISVRTKFMMETIDDLKNNRLKTGYAASAITSEHLIRMKKTLGSLKNRNLKAIEPLRIGLNDIRDSKKKGKWWLVGASWSGNLKDNDEILQPMVKEEKIYPQDPDSIDLVQLARENRMNTDVRRVIFVTIMSAEDYQDAYVRLKKLNLKKQQEYEISKVLVRCIMTEKYYNPYYTLIAKKLCIDKKLKTSFQYCLWDLLKRMDETEEIESDVEELEDLSVRRLFILSKMFGALIVEGSLDLSILKFLNLSFLSPKTKTFVEVLFITIFLQSQKQHAKKLDEKSIVCLFSKIKKFPHLIIGLQYFLQEVVSKTDLTGGNQESALIKWACKVAGQALVSANLE